MTAPIQCCPHVPATRNLHGEYLLADARDRIERAIEIVASRLGKVVCTHLNVVRAVFEAPVKAIVEGLVLECPECAVAAYILGHELVEAALKDVEQRCGMRSAARAASRGL